MIQPHIKEILDEWSAGKRAGTGGFLAAVLSNNLMEACVRADEHNARTLHEIGMYCYFHINSECWGSPEKYAAWGAKALAKLHAERVAG